MDAADLYASPHASEGFGLTVAEAMGHGKVVVASDFGGTTDFLDNSCGFPVGCERWELDHDEGPYRRGTVWGRIKEHGLAECLVKAAGLSGEERAELGAKARERIAARLSPDAVAAEMRASIDAILGG
jgi:glycosyltransferase involved in cell wall biosynthesis